MDLIHLDIVGYVLEKAIECVNGDWRFVYDASPQGYGGLKAERICTNIGELICEFYRFPGRVFFSAEAAVSAWMQAGANADVF